MIVYLSVVTHNKIKYKKCFKYIFLLHILCWGGEGKGDVTGWDPSCESGGVTVRERRFLYPATFLIIENRRIVLGGGGV